MRLGHKLRSMTANFSTGTVQIGRFFAQLLALLTACCSLSVSHVSVGHAQTNNLPVVKLLGVSGIKSQFLAVGEGKNAYYPIQVTRKGVTDAKPFYDTEILVADPLEKELLDDAADGRWDKFNVLTAALVAEGMYDRGKLTKYQNRLDQVLSSLKTQNLATLHPEEIAHLIFDALHHQILTGAYNQDCTDIAQTMDTGHFNCVSATVLFHAMAEKVGLDVRALEMRGHALSRVHLPNNQWFDLETTCADWFKLRHDPLLQQAAVLRVTAARPVGAPNQPVADSSVYLRSEDGPKTLREISGVQLIATIYYNRGFDLIKAGKFDESAAANIKALYLDPKNENAWGNLRVAINNKAIDDASQNDFGQAARLLDEGLLIDPDYELFRINRHRIYLRWITSKGEQKEYESAFLLCDEAEKRFPSQKNLQNIRYMLHHQLACNALKRRDYQEAFFQFDGGARIVPEEINASEIEMTEVLSHARVLMQEKNYEMCVTLLDQLTSRRPDSNSVVIPPFHLTAMMEPLPEVQVSYERTVYSPIGNGSTQTVNSGSLREVSTLRTEAVVAWTNESLATRDYPEAIRRVCIGAPAVDQMPQELNELLFKIHHDWIDALRSEGRADEADYLLQCAKSNVYLQGRF